MAATISNVTPRRNGFDFAALTASAGQAGSADEVERLRAALETLSELVVAHGVMDARTLASLLGDLVQPAQPVAPAAPLPPPAPSAAEARLTPVAQKVAPKAAAPKAVAPVVARKPAPAPVAAAPAAPAPVAVAPAPAPVAAAPAPVAAAPVASPFVATPAPAPVAKATEKPVERPAGKPVGTPIEKIEKKNSFAPVQIDAAKLAAELSDVPAPALKPQGFWSRLFGTKKTSPAAVAAAAASIEFTERTPKLPDDTLYAEQQRATELSFPPPSTVKKPRAASPRKRSSARPVDAAPARFCDRCWRRMDASGTCKSCSASA